MNNNDNNSKLTRLDTSRHGKIAEDFENFAQTKVIGQSRIIKAIGSALERDMAGFRSRKQPSGSFFIAGPSGVGKTSIVKVFAEFLLGHEGAYTRLEGQEFSESHRVAELKGSPPGYIGYDEPPRITQESLDVWGYKKVIMDFYASLWPEQLSKVQDLEDVLQMLLHQIDESGPQTGKLQISLANQKQAQDERLVELREELSQYGYPFYDITGSSCAYRSILLCDEIERAHKSFCNLLYTPLDEAYLPLTGYKASNGMTITRVRFNNTFIFATSNIGHDAVRDILNINNGKSTGFKFRDSSVSHDVSKDVYSRCRDDVHRHFEPSFLGRFNHFLVAQPLFRPEIRQIVDLKILELHKQLAKEWNCKLFLDIDEKAREFLVDESNDDPTIGARLVDKKIKRHLVDSLTSLKATNQIRKGDRLTIRLETPSDRPVLVFYKNENVKTKQLAITMNSVEDKTDLLDDKKE